MSVRAGAGAGRDQVREGGGERIGWEGELEGAGGSWRGQSGDNHLFISISCQQE